MNKSVPLSFLPLWEKAFILPTVTAGILSLFTATIDLQITHTKNPTFMTTPSK